PRIWQGHRIAGLTESFDSQKEYIVLEKLWKYNQAMLTLVKRAKKQLVIKPTQGSWRTRDIGRTICSIIGKKAFIQCAKMLKSLDLIFIEQLLDMQEKQIITWHYLKRVKEKSSKGKVPIWFKSIENQMITNFDTREIKQDLQTSSTNKLALISQRVKVSEDKCKLDWILVNNKENEPGIRRVISKSKEGFHTEKWLISKEEKVLQGFRKQNSSWVLDMTQSSLKEIRKNNIDLERTSKREIDKGLYSLEHASLTDTVYINRLERDYIKKQRFSEYCDGLLLNQLDRNIETDQKNSLIEIPTRNFIKELEDTRSAAEWRMLSTRTKRQHIEQTHWYKIEQAAIETVQALISESERRGKLRTSELQKYLFGEMYKEQKERREGYTQGLFKNTVIEELINQSLTKREADLALNAQKLEKRTKGQDKKKINRKKRKEKAEPQKNSYQKSKKLPNSKEATLQKVKDRKKTTNRRIDALICLDKLLKGIDDSLVEEVWEWSCLSLLVCVFLQSEK
ncbi:6827_t:CDS:2, partial [Dentiscutata erythropus]